MPKHACVEYRRVFKMLEEEGIFRPDRIPQLEEMSAFMKSKYRFPPVCSPVTLWTLGFLPNKRLHLSSNTIISEHSPSCIQRSVPNIIVNIRHGCLYKCVVVGMRKELQFLTVKNLVAVNSNESMVAPMVGSVGSVRLAEVWSQAASPMLGRMVKFSRNKQVFIFNSLTKLFKLCIFSAICKDLAAINFNALQHKKGHPR